LCGDEKIYYKSIPKLSVSLVMGQFGVKEGNGFRKITGKIGRKWIKTDLANARMYFSFFLNVHQFICFFILFRA
jgi:hypothetical protein